MILYSIIIPVYNVGQYLAECLESIKNQSYSSWEVILVDDGSNDGLSAEICDEYAEQDKRIRVYHRGNEGSLMARRYGIKQASGDYFLFFDSDDYIHKDLLKTINTIIEKNDSDLVIFRFQRVGGLGTGNSPVVFREGTCIGDDTLLKEQLWKKIVASCDFNNLATKAVKRDIIDMDTDYSPFAFLKSGTDLLQSLPILANARKIYFTEKVLYYYRFNPTGISASKKKKTDINSLEQQLKTRNVLQNEKLKYLKKTKFNTTENIKAFYKRCFEDCMEMLISWLSNENDKEKRHWFVQRMLKEKRLLDGKEYLEPADFTGKYRKLFGLFKGDKKQIYNYLHCLARRERGLNILRNVMYKIRQMNMR